MSEVGAPVLPCWYCNGRDGDGEEYDPAVHRGWSCQACAERALLRKQATTATSSCDTMERLIRDERRTLDDIRRLNKTEVAALIKERDTLKAERDEARKQASGHEWNRALQERDAKLDAANSQIVALREALEWFDNNVVVHHSHAHDPNDCPAACRVLRAALSVPIPPGAELLQAARAYFGMSDFKDLVCDGTGSAGPEEFEAGLAAYRKEQGK